MNIHHVHFNVEDQGQGIPFIWGHGLMSSIALESVRGFFQIYELQQVARVIRYDARGHGKSDPPLQPEDCSWDRLGQDMIAIADNLDIDKFVAGGASMGCATSLFAAIQHPERVAGLVLVIPPTAWETRADQRTIYHQMAQFTETHGPNFIRTMLANAPTHWALATSLDEREQALRNMYPQLPTVLRGAMLSDLPDKDKIRTITVPTLILAWTNDTGHPMSTADELKRLLPHAELHAASHIRELVTWTGRITAFLRDIQA